MERFSISRAKAVSIGDDLRRLGMLSHVVGEHAFDDSLLFYHFRYTEAAALAASSEASSTSALEQKAVQAHEESSVSSATVSSGPLDSMYPGTHTTLLAILVDAMSVDDGVSITDRKYRLRTYKQCLVAKDLVTFLADRYALQRSAACDIGQT